MKIVVAPNAFKDSMTTAEACQAIEEGIKRVEPTATTVCVHVADGGDGLHDVFKQTFPGDVVRRTVTGPLFDQVEAEYFFMPETRTAVVEMARASGIALLKSEQRDARTTTTRGTGELAFAAIEAGAEKVLVGLGGSATNDGGMGFAEALGVRFLDDAGQPVRPVGDDLGKVATIDLSGLKFDPAIITWEGVCDVDNPLTGDRGAAAVFGPQKGASPDDVRYLDDGLANLAKRYQEATGKDCSAIPGTGAAGGLGFGLVAFVNAELRAGVDVVLDMVGIDRELDGADLAITAEGRIDFQTAFGKGPAGVGARAKKHGVPCIAFAGGLLGDFSNLHDIGIDACFSLCPGPMSLEEAIRDGAKLLANATEQAFRAFLAGRRQAK
ncbi:MAG: glycerate kinase [Planctomycetes bacterium]|nr:glycerate kinase [Planctomycetota bacterium]